jgi:hypothetical protein
VTHAELWRIVGTNRTLPIWLRRPVPVLTEKNMKILLGLFAAILSLTPMVASAATSSISTTTAPITVACTATPTVTVTNDAELQAAINAASPGEFINLAPGTYTGAVTVPALSGTQTAPITVCGPPTAIIDAGGKSHGFYLNGTELVNGNMALIAPVDYWVLEGFTIQNANKGLDLANASHNTIIGVTVHNTSGAGIHVESFSSSNDFEGDLVYGTGGEGVYNGSAVSNWGFYSQGQADASDNNRYNGLVVYNTAADPFDLKEGSSHGTVSNNTFDGAANVKAKGWVDSKGNGWTISGNTGTNSNRDGFGNHVVAPGWGQGNVFEGNSGNVNGPGYAFRVDAASTGTIVTCGQPVTGAALGYSNWPCV